MPQEAPPNGGALGRVQGPWSRVAGMQAKLHRWAAADPGRRFDDLFNFVHDPATLIVAFARVAGNQGANTSPCPDKKPRVSPWLPGVIQVRLRGPGSAPHRPTRWLQTRSWPVVGASGRPGRPRSTWVRGGHHGARTWAGLGSR
jgi:hypothetical protein